MRTTSHPALPAQTTAGESLDVLIPAAAAGDRLATASLVNRYTSLIRSVARGYRLTDSDVDDVTQTVWMRCFQHLGRLREPRALPGWLKTTAQHEALRLSTAQVRSTAMDPIDLERILDRTGVCDGSADLLREEAGRAVRDGLAELPAAQRRLLTLLHADAQPSYREISEALGIPQGSIGPTRARSLAKLRRMPSLRTYLDTAGMTTGTG
jgi:RNA polymerase sigma factor (sigma-70 family)